MVELDQFCGARCWCCWCRTAGAGVGFFAFCPRVKGVYFSIITQALTFAAMLLFFRNATGFGGNNGFIDFKRILGCRSPPETLCFSPLRHSY